MKSIETVEFEGGRVVEFPERMALQQFLETLSSFAPDAFFESIEHVEYKQDGEQDIFTVVQDEHRSTDLGYAYGSAIVDNGYALVGVHKHYGDTERVNGFAFSPVIQSTDEGVKRVKNEWREQDFTPLEDR